MRPEKFLWLKNKKNWFFVFTFLVLSIIIFQINNSKIGASSAFFYPNVCLGGWTNPQNASGESKVKDFAEYSRDNSAVKEPNTSGQIFCGEFSGEVPKDADIKDLKLKLGLLIAHEEILLPEIDILESNETIIIEESDQNEPENIPTDEILDSEETKIIPEEYQAEEKVEIIEDKQEENLIKTTFEKINDFFNDTVYAQETSEAEKELIEDQTIINTENTLEINSNLEILEIENKEEEIENLTPQNDIISKPEEKETIETNNGTDLLEVFYTTDSVVWKSLGKITTANWETETFSLPIEEFSSWQDLSKLQISLQSLPTFELDQFIYLENVLLEINYEKIDPEKLKKITIEDKSGNIYKIKNENLLTSSKQAYMPNESPVFKLDEERTIETIINEFKIESIIEDNLNEQVDKIENTEEVINNEEKNTDSEENIITENTTPDIVQETENKEIENEPLPEKYIESETSENISLSLFKNIFKINKVFADEKKDGRPFIDKMYVIDHKNEKIDHISIKKESSGEIVLDNNGQLKPGFYQLIIEYKYDEKYLKLGQSFIWGEIFFNLSQDNYYPDDNVLIQITKISDGKPSCNSDLKIEIKNEQEILQIFTNENGIEQSYFCKDKTITDLANYFLELKAPKNPGQYKIELTDIQNNLTVSSYLTVLDGPKNIFKRSGHSASMKIDESNQMSFSFTNDKGLSGYIVETLPKNIYPVFNQNSDWEKAENTNGETLLIWELKEEDTEITKNYYYINLNEENYQAKSIGPLRIYDMDNNLILQEENKWQIFTEEKSRNYIDKIKETENKTDQEFENTVDNNFLDKIMSIFNSKKNENQNENSLKENIDYNLTIKEENNCQLNPFLVDLTQENNLISTLEIDQKNIKEDDLLIIGNPPAGISIVFLDNKEKIITVKKRDKKIDLKISKEDNETKGNFSIPIVITDKNQEKAHLICQINVTIN